VREVGDVNEEAVEEKRKGLSVKMKRLCQLHYFDIISVFEGTLLIG
jgi:hypothetical protein